MNGVQDKMREEPKIEIRLLTKEDAQAFHHFVEDNRESYGEIYKHWKDPSFTFTLEDAQVFFERMNTLGSDIWGIYEKEKLVGTISLVPEQNTSDIAEIGYIVDKDSRRRGIVTGALKKVLQIIPEQYVTLRAFPKPSNEISQRILQKVGFIRVGDTQDDRIIYQYALSDRKKMGN